MKKSINIFQMSDELEKVLEIYKRYEKAVFEIEDKFVFEDINTREKDPKIADSFLYSLSKNLYLFNPQFIYDLYEKINDIVFNYHISQLNLVLDLLEVNIPDSQSYFKTKMKSSITQERRTIRDLFLKEKWRKKEPKNELDSILKIFNFYKNQNIENNSILDLICENIFKTTIQIRNEILSKKRNLIIEIDIE